MTCSKYTRSWVDGGRRISLSPRGIIAFAKDPRKEKFIWFPECDFSPQQWRTNTLKRRMMEELKLYSHLNLSNLSGFKLGLVRTAWLIFVFCSSVHRSPRRRVKGCQSWLQQQKCCVLLGRDDKKMVDPFLCGTKREPWAVWLLHIEPEVRLW